MKYSILETDVKHVKDILSGKVALPFPGANSLVEAVKYIREEYKVGLSKSRIIVEQIAALPIAGHLHDHVDGAGREIVLPPDLKKDVLTLIASNEVVSAILAIRRTIPAIGLKEAKDLVDSMRHAMTDAERRKYKVGPSQCLKINLHYRLANQPQPQGQRLGKLYRLTATQVQAIREMAGNAENAENAEKDNIIQALDNPEE